MRSAFWAGLFAAIASPVFAGDWRETGNADDYIVAIDVSQIRRTGDISNVWAVQAGTDSYRVSRIDINCRRQTMTTLTATVYDSRSEILYSENRRDGPKDIYPDSTAASLARAACDHAYPARAGYNKASDFYRYAAFVLSASDTYSGN